MQRVWIAVMTAVIVLAGCSSSKKVYSANGTTVTTDTSQKTVTVQASDATMTMGKGVVDAASLGVPIYTGATEDEGSMSVSGTKGSTQVVAFSTPDSFDKVYEFYKSKMPAGSQKMKVDSGDSSLAEFVVGGQKAGEMTTLVMITKKDDKTSITITKGNQ